MWLVRNFPYLFLVPGVVMLLVGVTTAVKTWTFQQSAAHAEGTVIENHYEADSEGGGTYHPEVQFSASSGRRYRFVSTTGSSPASFKVGDTVKVLYDPSAPEQAAIYTFFHQWFLPLIFAGLGVVFAAVGAIPLYLRARRAGLNNWLKIHGSALQADFVRVQVNTGLEVNGANPYRIHAQWLNPSTKEVHLFHSENLWYDPTQYVTGKKMTVIVDPANFKRYWLDLTFLPKIAK